jgi:molybdenum cofactor cytidylyltransferase
MGAHKLLMPLGGRPLIAWSVLAASASQADDALIILGRDADAARRALPSGSYRVLINPTYAAGQGTSLALAVARLPEVTVGFVALLADQPFMTAASINRVVDVARREPERMVQGIAGGGAGHPVYLPRRVFPDLLLLNGDRGAREIIARERSDVRREPLENDLAHFDIDTPGDYTRALTLTDALPSYEA